MRSVKKSATSLGIALFLNAVAATAGVILVPSDVAVTLTATPTTGIRRGEPIYFTMTATNLGPQIVQSVGVKGPDLYNQFEPYRASNDCGLFTSIVDTQTSSYYYFNWGLTIPGVGSPMAIGETRTCHFVEYLTAAAPPVMAYTVRIPSYWVDINSSNDTATVILGFAAEPIPALSGLLRLGLVTLLGAIAVRRMRHVVSRG